MIGSQDAECKDVHTVGFPDFRVWESTARRKVRREEAGRFRIFYVVAALQSLRVKSHDPQRISNASQNPHPLQKRKTQRMRHPKV
jgi:hypothetical protein